MWFVTGQWQGRALVCLGVAVTAKVKEGESEGERMTYYRKRNIVILVTSNHTGAAYYLVREQ